VDQLFILPVYGLAYRAVVILKTERPTCLHESIEHMCQQKIFEAMDVSAVTASP